MPTSQVGTGAICAIAANALTGVPSTICVSRYLTAPNVKQSMEAHNDIQCTFIAQLEGKKRWRIWRVGARALKMLAIQSPPPPTRSPNRQKTMLHRIRLRLDSRHGRRRRRVHTSVE